MLVFLLFISPKNLVILAGTDKLGCFLSDGTGAWLHVLSNSKSTLYFPHVKRGKESMADMGILKDFSGQSRAHQFPVIFT